MAPDCRSFRSAMRSALKLADAYSAVLFWTLSSTWLKHLSFPALAEVLPVLTATDIQDRKPCAIVGGTLWFRANKCVV